MCLPVVCLYRCSFNCRYVPHALHAHAGLQAGCLVGLLHRYWLRTQERASLFTPILVDARLSFYKTVFTDASNKRATAEGTCSARALSTFRLAGITGAVSPASAKSESKSCTVTSTRIQHNSSTSPSNTWPCFLRSLRIRSIICAAGKPFRSS